MQTVKPKINSLFTLLVHIVLFALLNINMSTNHMLELNLFRTRCMSVRWLTFALTLMTPATHLFLTAFFAEALQCHRIGVVDRDSFKRMVDAHNFNLLADTTPITHFSNHWFPRRAGVEHRAVPDEVDTTSCSRLSHTTTISLWQKSDFLSGIGPDKRYYHEVILITLVHVNSVNLDGVRDGVFPICFCLFPLSFVFSFIFFLGIWWCLNETSVLLFVLFHGTPDKGCLSTVCGKNRHFFGRIT